MEALNARTAEVSKLYALLDDRIHPTPSASTRSSRSGTSNSANPQFRQTHTLGKAHTEAMSNPSHPGKCMFISVLNVLSSFEEHRLQVIAGTSRGISEKPKAESWEKVQLKCTIRGATSSPKYATSRTASVSESNVNSVIRLPLFQETLSFYCRREGLWSLNKKVRAITVDVAKVRLENFSSERDAGRGVTPAYLLPFSHLSIEHASRHEG